MFSDQFTAQDTWDLLTCDEVDEFGNRFWRDNAGRRHREDGPAVIVADGTLLWYKHGKLHREDGPAIIYPNGVVSYYLNGHILSSDEYLCGVSKS